MKDLLKIIFVFVTFLLTVACGVKGDPLPPERPAQMGRGKPTYKRATENLKLPNVQKNKKEEEEDKDE